jgi:hypothetical protein
VFATGSISSSIVDLGGARGQTDSLNDDPPSIGIYVSVPGRYRPPERIAGWRRIVNLHALGAAQHEQRLNIARCA